MIEVGLTALSVDIITNAEVPKRRAASATFLVLAPYRDVLNRFFQKYMSWASVKDDYIKLYMEAFTEKEIGDLVAFYKTKTGKKAAGTIPQLMMKGAAIGQKQVEKHTAELTRMLQEAMSKSGQPAK